MTQEPASQSNPRFSRVSCAEFERNWQDPMCEPTLDEILADPIVRLVFDRDHLDALEVERFLKAVSRRLASPSAVRMSAA
ncbi:MAG: hypothetical protein P4L82_18385 [Ancalomicrobiaceae bacterium]|nr:hypothetical protein [Ancalomicrobiaceae bacterium]